jgi:4-amino-4-deoxy-L-arabinose transferase-like glycosyltransferase
VTSAFARRLATIAGAGLVLRIVYVLAARRHSPLRGDEIFYSFQANALADGLGFNNPITRARAADHPPLTALVLTPASWIANHSVLAQRLTMAVVGAVVVVAVGWAAREIVDDRVGLVAAVLAAIYPQFWVGDGVAMSEPLATLGVALTLGLAYRVLRKPTATGAVLTGVAVGATVLARAELLLLLPFVVYPAAVLARSVPARRRVALAGIATVVAALVVAPWVLFNLARFDKTTLLSTNDGLTFVGANCASTYHGPGLGYWDLGCMAPAPPGDQSVANAALRHDGLSYARHHAGRLPVVVAARLGRVWGAFRPLQTARFAAGEGRPHWASYLSLVVYYALLPIAIGGLVVARRRRVPLTPLLGPVAVVVVIAAVFYGPARFRVPADVTIVVLAALALATWTRPARDEHDASRVGVDERAQAVP